MFETENLHLGHRKLMFRFSSKFLKKKTGWVDFIFYFQNTMLNGAADQDSCHEGVVVKQTAPVRVK